MSAFDDLVTLTDSSLDPIFWTADRPGVASPWWGHVPFAHWLVAVARPDVLVELGTSDGVSYSAFCRVVERMSLGTRCYAVNAQEAACSGVDAAFADFEQLHDKRYSAFSKLIRSNLDEAPRYFADRSIDFLHVDHLAGRDARVDFKVWKSKLSVRAVVLLHNTNLGSSDQCAQQLWKELSDRPRFEFVHGNGLGLVMVGGQADASIRALCSIGDASLTTAIRRRFAAVGERWVNQAREAATADDYNRRISEAIAETDRVRSEAHEWEVRAKDHARARAQIALRIDAARHDVYEANLRAEQAEAAAAQAQVLSAKAQAIAAEAHASAAEAQAALALSDQKATQACIEADRLMRERDAVLSSRIWRATSPVRQLANMIKRGLASAFPTMATRDRWSKRS